MQRTAGRASNRAGAIRRVLESPQSALNIVPRGVAMSDSGTAALPRTTADRADWKRVAVKLLSLAISAILLLVLYRSLDMRAVGTALRSAHLGWLAASVGMIVPITVFRAMRFGWIAPAGSVSGLAEALRLTLVANAFNIFMPAKAGDFAKSFYIARRAATPRSVAIAVVVYERLADFVGLIFWCLVCWMIERPLLRFVPSYTWVVLALPCALCGVLILSRRSAELLPAAAVRIARIAPRTLSKLAGVAEGWPALLRHLDGRRLPIVTFSLFLWLLQLLQIWMFSVAVSAGVPFVVCMTFAAVAVLAGQLPFTFSGVGASDVAIVALLSGYTTPEAAAAIGILMAFRGLLPAVAGVAIIRPYVARAVDRART
jgi:uncharacterized protein (TIRG00374 family)